MRLDQFVERLSRVSAKEITRSAKERQNGSLGFAEAMLQVYNKRTKYPLSFQRLFKAKYDSEYEELEQEPESEVVEEDTESPSEDQPAQLSFASFTDLDYPIAE